MFCVGNNKFKLKNQIASIIFSDNLTPTGFFIYEARRADIIVINRKNRIIKNPKGMALLFEILYVIHLNRYKTNNFMNIHKFIK